jgi:hypothetical protein
VSRRKPSFLSSLTRLVPFGSFAGLGTVALVGDMYVLAALMGVGATVAGKRLLDRRENARRELRRRVRANVAELGRVARQDGVAAPQMSRLVALQDGVLESWELLPEPYRPLLDEDIFTIVEEIEGTARLARRRAALRRHLESVNRREISARIQALQKDLALLEPGSALRAPFESALAGRRGELAGYDDILNGISMINAQLEGAESLLGNLRGELLALDTSLAPHSLESGLVRLRERVAYFRRSLDEVTRSVEPLPDPLTGELPAR